MINPNLRFLKRNEEVFAMRTGLCAACGNQDSCLIRAEKVQACSDYQPVIAFKSTAGMDGIFNTFRLGGAWSKRVAVNEKVGIVNVQGEKLFEAQVIQVECGDKLDMLEGHARKNHLMLAKPHEDPKSELGRLLRNLYGGGFFAKANLLTVIYLKRI